MVNGEELEGTNILQPYTEFVDGLVDKTFEGNDEMPAEDIQLARGFLLDCLITGYDSLQLFNLQNRLRNGESGLTLEVIKGALGKLDQQKYQKELVAIFEALGTIDFSKPQKPFDFLFKLGLLDSESDMCQLWQAITSAMPKDFQSVLAVQSF